MKKVSYLTVVFCLFIVLSLNHCGTLDRAVSIKKRGDPLNNKNKLTLYVGNETNNIGEAKILVFLDGKQIIDGIFENDDDPHIEYNFLLTRSQNRNYVYHNITCVSLANNKVEVLGSFTFYFTKQKRHRWIIISYESNVFLPKNIAKEKFDKKSFFRFGLYREEPEFD